MSPNEKITPTEAIARQVSALRTQRGFTAKELGERMTAQGLKWDRFTVSALEKGKRQNVVVDELLALARALDVSPLTLLMPYEGHALTVAPDLTVDPFRLVLWFAGERPAAGLPTVQFERDSAALRWYRAAYDTERRANEADRNARWARKEGEEAEADQLAAERDRLLQSLAGIIDSLIEAGMTPQPVNQGWARKMIRRGWFRNPDRVPVVELPEDGDNA